MSLQKSCVLAGGMLRSCRYSMRQLAMVTHAVNDVCANRTLFSASRTLCQPEVKSRAGVMTAASRQDLSWCLQRRFYAKGKSKPSKGTKTMQLDDSEVEGVVDIHKYREDLNKVVDQLKEEYIHQLSLRTNVGVFDKLQVKTKDGVFPLNQIASIVQKTPTLIVLNLSQSVQYMPDVMTAIKTSGMNLNPQQEGPTAIYLTLAKVSREHREELAKNAKMLFNNAKEKMNHIFAHTMKKVNKEKSFDLKKGAETLLLHEKNQVQDAAEKLMKAKQKELLGE